MLCHPLKKYNKLPNTFHPTFSLLKKHRYCFVFSDIRLLCFIKQTDTIAHMLDNNNVLIHVCLLLACWLSAYFLWIKLQTFKARCRPTDRQPDRPTDRQTDSPPARQTAGQYWYLVIASVIKQNSESFITKGYHAFEKKKKKKIFFGRRVPGWCVRFDSMLVIQQPGFPVCVYAWLSSWCKPVVVSVCWLVFIYVFSPDNPVWVYAKVWPL